MGIRRDPNAVCMTCDHFKLKGQPGAKEGMGLCTIYERPTRWDWASVLYTPAATMMDRRRWLEKFQEKDAAKALQENNHDKKD